MLQALTALLTFQCLGEGVSYVFHLPVPGPVIGMLLLVGFIMLRPQTADAIEPTALELLRHQQTEKPANCGPFYCVLLKPSA